MTDLLIPSLVDEPMRSQDFPRPDDSPADGKEYRLPRKYLGHGIGFTVLFALIGIASTFVAALNVDGSFPNPVPMAVVFGCFWAGMSSLGVWLILAYCRVRLFVSPQVVRTTGCFRIREVQLADVVRAVWSPWFQGVLVLHGPAGKVRVYFANFTAAEQADLIQFFRGRLDERIQEGWDRFESYCVRPSPVFQQRRDRERRRAYWLIPVFGSALIAVSLWDP